MKLEIMQIQFKNNTRIVESEGSSKLLDVDSVLVKHLEKTRDLLHSLFPEETIKGSDRPWHIELVHRYRNIEGNTNHLVVRAGKLQGKFVDTQSLQSYTVMDEKAVVLKCPEVDGYGVTHVTIGYFVDGIDDKKLK